MDDRARRPKLSDEALQKRIEELKAQKRLRRETTGRGRPDDLPLTDRPGPAAQSKSFEDSSLAQSRRPNSARITTDDYGCLYGRCAEVDLRLIRILTVRRLVGDDSCSLFYETSGISKLRPSPFFVPTTGPGREDRGVTGRAQVLFHRSDAPIDVGVKISIPAPEIVSMFPKERWPANAEASILQLLSQELFRERVFRHRPNALDGPRVSPHMVHSSHLVGFVAKGECDPGAIANAKFPFVPLPIANAKKRLRPGPDSPSVRATVLLSEWKGGTTLREAVDVLLDPDRFLPKRGTLDAAWTSIVVAAFQVCWTLSCAYTLLPNFRHNDLSIDSVLVMTGFGFEFDFLHTDNARLLYVVGSNPEEGSDVAFEVPATRLWVCLWNFDWSSNGAHTNAKVDLWSAKVRRERSGPSHVPPRARLESAQVGVEHLTINEKEHAQNQFYYASMSEILDIQNHGADFAQFYAELMGYVAEKALALGEAGQGLHAKAAGALEAFARLCETAVAGSQGGAHPSPWYVMMHTDAFAQFRRVPYGPLSRDVPRLEMPFVHPSPVPGTLPQQ